MSEGESTNPPPWQAWLSKTALTSAQATLALRPVHELARHIVGDGYQCPIDKNGMMQLSISGKTGLQQNTLNHTDLGQSTPFSDAVKNSNGLVLWISTAFCNPLPTLPNTLNDTVRDDIEKRVDAACEAFRKQYKIPFEHKLVVLPAEDRGTENPRYAALILAASPERLNNIYTHLVDARNTARAEQKQGTAGR